MTTNSVCNAARTSPPPAPSIRSCVQAWRWLGGGSILLGTQSIIFVSTLAVFGKATSANIVYASRGLLSVGLVWMIGHWFVNAEQHLGPKVMRWRLAGALLMMSAIVLVVV